METEAQLSPGTPQVIRELQNYHSFSFAHSLLRARDMYKHENRAIGVFTSGDDAPGKHAVETESTFITSCSLILFCLNKFTH